MTFQAETATKSRPKRISPQAQEEELLTKQKALITTSNDNDLGIEMFTDPEKGRCVKVRKL